MLMNWHLAVQQCNPSQLHFETDTHAYTGSLHLLLQEQERSKALSVSAAAQGYSGNCMLWMWKKWEYCHKMSTGIASWWWKCILHQQSYLNRVKTPTMFPGTTRSPNEVLLLKTCRNEWAVCNRVHGALQWPQLEIGFNDSLYRQDVNTQFTQESRATHSQGRQEWWRRKENSSHTLEWLHAYRWYRLIQVTLPWEEKSLITWN